MKKGIIFALVVGMGVALVLLTRLYPTPNPWVALLVALLVNFISTPVYAAGVDVLYHLGHVRLWFQTRVYHRDDEVRLSIAYLFRIRVKGKYLLVKNRKGNYYQLVGGAYKAFPTAQRIFDRYLVKPDKRFETEHGIAKNDLRFRVPGRHVLAMLAWFRSQKDREISQWREFCEELLTPGLLPQPPFRYIDYTYAGSLQTPLQQAKKLPCQEILLYEIFDLIPNDEQRLILEQLLDEGDTADLKWADETLINHLGFDERTKEVVYEIGPHTKWALNLRWGND
jgi:SMODS-associated NUDIX domain